jgi:cell division protein FtsL
MQRLAPFALAALLVACALALVTSQYRARGLFAELEVAQQEAKTLESEGARLRSDLGRVAQPATVEAVARRLGMRAIDPGRIVFVPAAGTPGASELARAAGAGPTTVAQAR